MVDEVLTWMDRLVKFVKRYSIFDIVKSWMVFVMFVIITLSVINAENIFNWFLEEKEKNDITKLEDTRKVRKDIEPIISKLLGQTILDIGCNWVFVLEGHNGTHNLNGLGFEGARLMYQASTNFDRLNKESLNTNDLDLRVNGAPIFNYLRKKKYFYGSIQELQDIDYHFAKDIFNDNVKFVISVVIPRDEDITLELGTIFCAYSTEVKWSQEVIRDYLIGLRWRMQKLLSLDINDPEYYSKLNIYSQPIDINTIKQYYM